MAEDDLAMQGVWASAAIVPSYSGTFQVQCEKLICARPVGKQELMFIITMPVDCVTPKWCSDTGSTVIRNYNLFLNSFQVLFLILFWKSKHHHLI